MIFWERFYNLCIENNTKPNPLGVKLGIPSATIAGWKKGSYPNALYLDKIANYFDCSIDYLLGKTDIKKEQAADEQQPVSDTMKKIIENVHNLSPENQEIVARLVEQLAEE